MFLCWVGQVKAMEADDITDEGEGPDGTFDISQMNSLLDILEENKYDKPKVMGTLSAMNSLLLGGCWQ